MQTLAEHLTQVWAGRLFKVMPNQPAKTVSRVRIDSSANEEFIVVEFAEGGEFAFPDLAADKFQIEPLPDAPEIIVAEVSKSWKDEPDGFQHPDQPRTLAQVDTIISKQFELVIATNARRGYRLHQWQFRSASYPDRDGAPIVTETIIATFEKVRHA